MAQYFLSAFEYIKTKVFDVWVPEFYHPHLPEHMLDPRPAPLERVNRFRAVTTKRRSPMPFRRIEDPHQMQKASYSIEIMLDMFRKKVEFELCNEEDIVEILDGLDRYLLSLENDVKLGEERAVEYAKLVINWREEVYKNYYRYMKLNPAALEKLYPNNNPTQNLLYLMSAVSGVKKENLELDPLRARAEPPYRVEKIIPQNNDGIKVGEMEFETSLGLSKASSLLNDDGKDFNFDDFLNRG